MSRLTIVLCDAPGCDRQQTVGDFDGCDPERWYIASLRAEHPVDHEPECEHDPGWHWEPEDDQIDACCLEHLRAAMASSIAALTDEEIAT